MYMVLRLRRQHPSRHYLGYLPCLPILTVQAMKRVRRHLMLHQFPLRPQYLRCQEYRHFLTLRDYQVL